MALVAKHRNYNEIARPRRCHIEHAHGFFLVAPLLFFTMIEKLTRRASGDSLCA